MPFDTWQWNPLYAVMPNSRILMSPKQAALQWFGQIIRRYHLLCWMVYNTYASILDLTGHIEVSNVNMSGPFGTRLLSIILQVYCACIIILLYHYIRSNLLQD